MGKLGNFRVPPQKNLKSTIFSINKGLLSFEIRQLDNGTALTNIHINKGPGKECWGSSLLFTCYMFLSLVYIL